MNAVGIAANIHIVDQVFQDFAEGQRHNGEVVASQAHDRQADDDAEQSRHHAAADNGDDQQQNLAGNDGLQQRRHDDAGKGAHPHKSGMTQAQLTGNAHHQVQGNGQNDVGTDGNQEAFYGTGKHMGCGQHLHDDKAQDDHTVGYQIRAVAPNVLFQFHGTHLTLSPARSCPAVRRA